MSIVDVVYNVTRVKCTDYQVHTHNLRSIVVYRAKGNLRCVSGLMFRQIAVRWDIPWNNLNVLLLHVRNVGSFSLVNLKTRVTRQVRIRYNVPTFCTMLTLGKITFKILLIYNFTVKPLYVIRFPMARRKENNCNNNEVLIPRYGSRKRKMW